MSIRFEGQVAIVTGSGNGLGRSHALQLAARGAKVVINDFGGARDGTGGSSAAAEKVVAEIVEAGGEAMANGANVADWTQVQNLVSEVMDKWGRIDILINNAGILRDKSFGKMEISDWDAVVDVHLNGTAYCSRAVWNVMKEQNYGRIVNTTSTSGIYGNFGQANYGAAKDGVVGLMNTLHIEGAKNNIHINCIAPTAATRMTEDIIPEAMLAQIAPEHVTQAVLYLVSKDGPSRTIMLAGAGCYSVAKLMESDGIYIPEADRSPETIAAQFDAISDMSDAREMMTGNDHVMKIIQKATAGAKG
jgi:NAD(P)-dependent dehydrogenase (short-subunit alcohol dehydrogenase family)